MDKKIDWISFTLETGREPSTHYDLRLLAEALIKKVGNGHAQYIFDGQGFEPAGTRTPYRICLGREDHGVRIYGNSPTATILVELSGRACDGLRSFDDQQGFLSPLALRLSRLDYAADIRTNTRPADFTNGRNSKVFRTVSFIKSDTGETVYVGSTKSDRFCRVYRYAPPHPRAELLRVEFVFRRGLARIACRELCQSSSAEEFTARLGATFGFNHKDWQPGVKSNEKIPTATLTQREEDTVMWLYKQVAPAVRRMIATGALDVTDWLEFIYAPERQITAESAPAAE